MKTRLHWPSLLLAFAIFACLGFGPASCVSNRDPLPAEVRAAELKHAADQAKEFERRKLQETTSQHLANLTPIGHSVEAKGLPDEGKAVISETDAVVSALGMSKADLPAPKRNLEQWLKDSEEARTKLEGEKVKLQRELESLRQVSAALDEQAKKAEAAAVLARQEADSLWNKVRNSAITGTVATIGIGILSAFNGPAGNLANGLLSLVIPGMRNARRKIAELEDQHGTLVTTVASADVAREGLRALDEKMSPEVRAVLASTLGGLTGKPVDSLEDYFKMLARGHAVDQGAARAVDSMLDELRDTNPTLGGVSTALSTLLSAWQKGAPTPNV